MDLYSAATCMEVNIVKSIISFIGMNDKSERQFLQFFPFRSIDFSYDSSNWDMH
jgi:hypothetical protein